MSTVSNAIRTEFTGSLGWPECLENRKGAPDQPAVYAIWSQAPFPRLNGETNVLYIGSTLRLGGATDGCRLYSYRFSPQRHATDIRTRTASLVKMGGILSLRWVVVPDEQSARAKERELLKGHLMEHWELPPFNGRR